MGATMPKRPSERTAATRATRPPSPRRVSASLEAYQNMRELIIAGRLAPGAHLVETDLCARLAMSRTPVRAALQRLQEEGFVVGETVGNMVRALVAPLTAEDMHELFAIVGALDAIAARWAAELEPVKRQRLVNELERLNREMSAAARARPPQVAYAQDLHERFHHAIADTASGPRLRAELRSLQPQAERYGRAYTGASIRHFDDSLREHDAIIDAIRAGDADSAEHATAINWSSGAERYRRVVEADGEPDAR